MKTKRKIIEIDEELCDGCGQCILSCAEGALQIVDGKARVISDNLCDGLGACMEECPTGALQIIERDAEEFDEEAVEKHLSQTTKEKEEAPSMACGCPSQNIQTLAPLHTIKTGNDAKPSGQPSALSNWPVQIRLIPANAPFLKNADILVTADCAAVAYPSLHDTLLAGKIVMMGCPKFDDADEYIEKFREIFTHAGINSLTVVSMEVPCCSGLPWIVKKALEAAGKKIPITEIVISARGKILSEKKASPPTKSVPLNSQSGN